MTGPASPHHSDGIGSAGPPHPAATSKIDSARRGGRGEQGGGEGEGGEAGSPRPGRVSRRPGRVSRRVARALTEVFAPAVLACVLPLVIGARSGLGGFGWGLVAALLGAVLPYAMILNGVRRGRLSDRHIGVRAQRTKPLALGLLSVLAALILLVTGGAPRDLIALMVASFTGGAVATAVNHFWKLSVHASVAAGTAVVLTIAFGPWLACTAILVAAVAWSRVRLADHTPAQVCTGIALGALIAGVLFGLLR